MIVLFEIHLSGILKPKPNQIIKCRSKLTGWNLFDKRKIVLKRTKILKEALPE